MKIMKRHVKHQIIILNILLILGCTSKEKIQNEDIVEHSRQSLRDGLYYNAIYLLNQIIDQEPKPKEYHLIQGLGLFKIGDFSKSLVNFKKAAPTSLGLKIHIAYIHLILGDLKSAKSAIYDLESQYGEDLTLALLKGNVRLKERRYKDARVYFRQTLFKVNNYYKAYLGIANSYFLEMNYAKSEENYIKAILHSDRNIHSYIALSKFYIAMGRYRDAEDSLKIALEFYPWNTNLVILLGNLYIKGQKYSKAAHLLERPEVQSLNSTALITQLIRCYFYLNQPAKAYEVIKNLRGLQDQEIARLSGEYFIRINNLDYALPLFYEARANDDNTYLSDYYLGLIHLLKDNVLLSVSLLEKSIQSYPSFTNSHLLLASIYLHQKKYNLALEHVRLVLKIAPNNISAHSLSGILLYMQGHLKEAEYEFSIVSHLDPQNPASYFFKSLIMLAFDSNSILEDFIDKINVNHIERLYLMLQVNKRSTEEKDISSILGQYIDQESRYLYYLIAGNYYKQSGNITLANKYTKETITINNKCSICYYQQAEIEQLMGNYDTARKHLQQSIKLDEYFIKAYHKLGILYEQVEDYDKARQTYKKGLIHHPDDPILLNNLAWVLLAYLNDQSASYSYITKAMSLLPKDPDVSDTLAWWYYQNGYTKKAKSTLEYSISVQPNNPYYRYHLGMIYLKLEDYALAASNLRRAIELGIEDEYISKIQATLKRVANSNRTLNKVQQ